MSRLVDARASRGVAEKLSRRRRAVQDRLLDVTSTFSRATAFGGDATPQDYVMPAGLGKPRTPVARAIAAELRAIAAELDRARTKAKRRAAQLAEIRRLRAPSSTSLTTTVAAYPVPADTYRLDAGRDLAGYAPPTVLVRAARAPGAAPLCAA